MVGGDIEEVMFAWESFLQHYVGHRRMQEQRAGLGSCMSRL